MPVSPSLSRLERERIAEAARLVAAGVRVRWRCIGMRLVYVVDGREHLVFTAGTQWVFDCLCQQAKAEFQRLGGLANVNECSSAA